MSTAGIAGAAGAVGAVVPQLLAVLGDFLKKPENRAWPWLSDAKSPILGRFTSSGIFCNGPKRHDHESASASAALGRSPQPV